MAVGPLVLILALDTTTRAGSAAVLDDDRVLALVDGDGSRTHGERLPGELAQALADAGIALAAVDLLAVASGPGAFTGLRIGLATMQAVAMTTGRPVVGISALEAIAAASFERLGVVRARIGSCMDAARGEVFGAVYDADGEPGQVPRLVERVPPQVGAAGALWSGWRAYHQHLKVAGDGAARYVDQLGTGTRTLPHPVLAPAVGRLARRLLALGGPHLPHHLQPLYVRRPDVQPRSASAVSAPDGHPPAAR